MYLMTLLLASLPVAPLSAPPPTLPADPFQRCATRVLSGEFGPVDKLPAWKVRAYRTGLARNVTTRTLVVTQYNGEEPDGVVDGRGLACTMRTAAANSIPRYSIVWVAIPNGTSTLREVLDCGGRGNDARARRVARSAGITDDVKWLDLWFTTKQHATRHGVDGWKPMPGAVVR